MSRRKEIARKDINSCSSSPSGDNEEREVAIAAANVADLQIGETPTAEKVTSILKKQNDPKEKLSNGAPDNLRIKSGPDAADELDADILITAEDKELLLAAFAFISEMLYVKERRIQILQKSSILDLSSNLIGSTIDSDLRCAAAKVIIAIIPMSNMNDEKEMTKSSLAQLFFSVLDELDLVNNDLTESRLRLLVMTTRGLLYVNDKLLSLQKVIEMLAELLNAIIIEMRRRGNPSSGFYANQSGEIVYNIFSLYLLLMGHTSAYDSLTCNSVLSGMIDIIFLIEVSDENATPSNIHWMAARTQSLQCIAGLLVDGILVNKVLKCVDGDQGYRAEPVVQSSINSFGRPMQGQPNNRFEFESILNLLQQNKGDPTASLAATRILHMIRSV